jgi:hypothetical protein
MPAFPIKDLAGMGLIREIRPTSCEFLAVFLFLLIDFLTARNMKLEISYFLFLYLSSLSSSFIDGLWMKKARDERK